MKKLQGKKIAILLCDGFEEVEMTKPRELLKKAGATLKIISPNPKKIKAWAHDHWSKSYKVDIALDKADPTQFDAIILPGGVLNPDKLRTNKKAIKFIKHFLARKKLVAAICHGPWTLIETGKLKGRKLTSYHSIKTDLVNAGSVWQNKNVVKDKQLITSRMPKDIPYFVKAIISSLAE